MVPLQTADGPALLVDRGWLATANSGAVPDDVPAPPAGEVTITAYVRKDATGDSARVFDPSTRAISSEQIGPAIGREVYGGFVDLETEDPAPRTPLAKPELPDLSSGPHFFYGLQWWFFGLMPVFGFVYLAYVESRGGTGRRHRARNIPPSTGSITPETNDAAGDSRKAAERPNSSGSP